MVLPCSLKSCTNNALCAFKSGSVECRCPDVNDCSTVRNPVCGSDGSTHKVYDNLCFMEAESCKMGKRISPVTADKCGEFLFTVLLKSSRPLCLVHTNNANTIEANTLGTTVGQAQALTQAMENLHTCEPGQRNANAR